MPDATPFLILEYVRPDGTCPFRDWLDSLERVAHARIQARIDRFEQGNLGDHKGVSEGLLEARCNFGPGFRIYFGRHRDRLVILLIGGDKRSQLRDINTAKLLWHEYLRRSAEAPPTTEL